MALTSFSFGKVGYTSGGGVIPALIVDGDLVTEDIAPTGTTASTTAVAPEIGSLAACRVMTDTSVYISFGTAPNAGTDTNRILLLANQTITVLMPAGYKGAAITVA